MMKLSDDKVTTLVKHFNLPNYSYVATCGNKIYQTNHNTSTVTCYTMKGEKLWEYKDVSVLKDPRDVTVGNNYNVYVTSYTCNSVVVLEPGGRQGRQLISSNDGLSVLLDYILTNIKTVCWLLTTMDRLSCIICVQSCLGVRVLLYILVAKQNPNNFL